MRVGCLTHSDRFSLLGDFKGIHYRNFNYGQAAKSVGIKSTIFRKGEKKALCHYMEDDIPEEYKKKYCLINQTGIFPRSQS